MKTKSLHPSVRAIQRSRSIGKTHRPMTTVGIAAYHNRMDLHLEADRFLEAHNYKFGDRGEEQVIARGILSPENAPEYLKDVDPSDKGLYRECTGRLWNDAEHAGASPTPSRGVNGCSPSPANWASRRRST